MLHNSGSIDHCSPTKLVSLFCDFKIYEIDLVFTTSESGMKGGKQFDLFQCLGL